MFHLDYKPEKSPWQISHMDALFLVGSCFAENMAECLKQRKFNIHANPHGILFNPISIAKSISDILNQNKVEEQFFVERDGLSFSFHHHSQIYAKDRTTLREHISQINTDARTALLNSQFLLITFGSAHAYKHLANNEIVANCHKQAGHLFKKELMTQPVIFDIWKDLILDLQKHIPNLKIIFTVSPVKYLKDGVHENNLSKATLLLSIHELINALPNCYYFPAFELVNDDLRDYRFYKSDMAHPNEQAVNYVWQRFSETYFLESTIQLNRQLEKLHLAMQHRFLQAESERVSLFRDSHLQLISSLEKQFPFLNFTSERHYFDVSFKQSKN